MADAVGRPKDPVPVTGDSPTNPTFVEVVDSSGTEKFTDANPGTIKGLVGVKGKDGSTIAQDANPLPVEVPTAFPVPIRGQDGATIASASNPLPITVTVTSVDVTDIDQLTVTGSGTALNDTPIAKTDLLNRPFVSLRLFANGGAGGSVITATFEGSTDGSNYTAVELRELGNSTWSLVSAPGFNPNDVRVFYGVVPYRYFRVRVSSVAGSPGTLQAWANFRHFGALEVQRGLQASTVAASVALATDQMFQEDTAHVSGDRGLMPLAVANEAAVNLSGTDGKYTPFAVDRVGRQKIKQTVTAGAIVNGSATAAGTIVTIPANKTFRGVLSVSGASRATVGGAATDFNVRITWTPGTGGTTASTPCQTDFTISNNLVGSGGENASGNNTSEVMLYAGTTNGTLALATTGTPQQSWGMVNGVLEDAT